MPAEATENDEPFVIDVAAIVETNSDRPTGQAYAAQVGVHAHNAKSPPGPGFPSPNRPDQGRATAYRDSPGPNSRSDGHCATSVGD